MAPAMFQSSKESLGGTPPKKLVRGRTKYWIDGPKIWAALLKKCSDPCGPIDFREIKDSRWLALSAQLDCGCAQIIQRLSAAYPQSRSARI
jgi:hypothetical protein